MPRAAAAAPAGGLRRGSQRIVKLRDQHTRNGTAMPDILGQGEDRPPRRWPRGLAVAAAAALVTVVIVTHLPRERAGAAPPRPQASAHSQAPPAAPAAIAAPVPAAGPAESPGRPCPGTPACGCRSPGRGRSGYGRPPAARSGSAACPRTGPATSSPGSAAAGRSRPPPGPGPAAATAPRRRCRSTSSGTRPRSPPRSGSLPTSRRAPAAGTLWLTRFPPDASLAATAAAAQEVSVAGRRSGRSCGSRPGT